MRDNIKQYFVYILTNKSHTLYIGITSDIVRRLHEHKHKFVKGFTAKYNIHKLIYVEQYRDALSALNREKQLKGWTRNRKVALIKESNPTFHEIFLD